MINSDQVPRWLIHRVDLATDRRLSNLELRDVLAAACNFLGIERLPESELANDRNREFRSPTSPRGAGALYGPPGPWFDFGNARRGYKTVHGWERFADYDDVIRRMRKILNQVTGDYVELPQGFALRVDQADEWFNATQEGFLKQWDTYQAQLEQDTYLGVPGSPWWRAAPMPDPDVEAKARAVVQLAMGSATSIPAAWKAVDSITAQRAAAAAEAAAATKEWVEMTRRPRNPLLRCTPFPAGFQPFRNPFLDEDFGRVAPPAAPPAERPGVAVEMTIAGDPTPAADAPPAEEPPSVATEPGDTPSYSKLFLDPDLISKPPRTRRRRNTEQQDKPSPS
jgi:hypothetical protein